MTSPADPGGAGAVYVMSNQDTGNSVTVFTRASDGALTRLRTYSTGGLGAGNSISAQSDPLGSQGALVLSQDGRFLFGVDAGSNEISVLAVKGETLVPVDRVPSGGVRPVSLTVYGTHLYVVNHDDATVTGFVIASDGKLSALPRSTQKLIGGTDADPSQVGFTPDGSQLVVTEKGTSLIDVFPVDDNGRIGVPVKNESNGPVPFAFTFAGKDLLIVSELSNATSSYRLAPNGTLTPVTGSLSTSEAGACWVVTDNAVNPSFAYVSNALSGTITGYGIDTTTGALRRLAEDGHTAITRDTNAALDSAASSDGRFLYVLTGGFNELSSTAVVCNKMTISAFRIAADGQLGTLPGFGTDDAAPPDVPPVGLAPGSQGIVAI